MSPVRHVYVHVPFCDGQCLYCGFYSLVRPPDMHARYARLPARELALRRERPAPETLYLGGGTPSVMADELEILLETLLEAMDCSGLRECTVEVSPGHVTPASARAWARLGVNRVSLGVQSFDDSVLREMRRRHDTGDILRAVGVLRSAGDFSVGLDLIAGWPGVGAEGWARTLDAALALGPDHVSVYGLSVEPGSLLAEEGIRVGDDTIMDALAQAEERLCPSGYERYEISNYALPGRACGHNLAVWRGMDYLGLGPAAFSRRGRHRTENEADLEAYIKALEKGRLPPRRRRTVSAADDREERFVAGIRLSEGVDPGEFMNGCGRQMPRTVALWTGRLQSLASVSLVSRTGSRWRLTSRGREVADGVMRELVEESFHNSGEMWQDCLKR